MDIVSPRVKRILTFTAIALLLLFGLVVVATEALARPGLEYAEGVEPTKGIGFLTAPQAALGRDGYPLLRGTATVTKPTRQAAPAASGDVWGRLRNCESPDGRSSSDGRYHNWFQFDVQTWHSVGGQGHPRDASYPEALKRAKRLQASRGWGPWPSCSRQLGLR